MVALESVDARAIPLYSAADTLLQLYEQLTYDSITITATKMEHELLDCVYTSKSCLGGVFCF
jgi:hypothetical protein